MDRIINWQSINYQQGIFLIFFIFIANWIIIMLIKTLLININKAVFSAIWIADIFFVTSFLFLTAHQYIFLVVVVKIKIILSLFTVSHKRICHNLNFYLIEGQNLYLELWLLIAQNTELQNSSWNMIFQNQAFLNFLFDSHKNL